MVSGPRDQEPGGHACVPRLLLGPAAAIRLFQGFVCRGADGSLCRSPRPARQLLASQDQRPGASCSRVEGPRAAAVVSPEADSQDVRQGANGCDF